MKVCTSCNEKLPLDAFIKRTDRPGRQARCRACVSAYNRARYAADRERFISAAHGWQDQNRDRVNANTRAYQRSHPALVAAAKRVRRLRMTNHLAEADIQARLAFFGNKCWMCGSDAGTLDHVKPLSKGGAHILANIRPACRSCNSRKSGKWLGVHALDAFQI